MNTVLFVTGCSAAGKTTLGRALAKLPTTALWTDLDEHATERPQTAWLDWLRWRAAESLRAAPEAENHTDPEHTGHGLVVVTGIVWPFRVIESPAWGQVRGSVEEVIWLLLDPPWRTVRARLAERLDAKPRRERDDIIRYNRGLLPGLRDQVAALRRGHRSVSTDPATLLAQTTELVAW